MAWVIIRDDVQKIQNNIPEENSFYCLFSDDDGKSIEYIQDSFNFWKIQWKN